MDWQDDENFSFAGRIGLASKQPRAFVAQAVSASGEEDPDQRLIYRSTCRSLVSIRIACRYGYKRPDRLRVIEAIREAIGVHVALAQRAQAKIAFCECDESAGLVDRM